MISGRTFTRSSSVVTRDPVTEIPPLELVETVTVADAAEADITNHGFELTFRIFDTTHTYTTTEVTIPGHDRRLFHITNLTPGLCALNGWELRWREDGTSWFRVSYRGVYQDYPVELPTDVWNKPGQYTVWTGFEPGSYTEQLAAPLMGALNANKDSEYFTDYVRGCTTATRNPNCWLAHIDLSGSAISTTLWPGLYWSENNTGALLTPRHWIGVKHWETNDHSCYLGKGDKLLFVDGDGVSHERTIVGRCDIQALVTGTAWPDWILLTLDSDLPASVPPFDIAGNWLVEEYERPSGRIKGVGFQINQFKQIGALSFDCTYNVPQYMGYATTMTLGEVTVTDVVSGIVWDNFQSYKTYDVHPFHGMDKFIMTGIIGDSGSMIGMVAGDRAVLVSLFTGAYTGYLIYEGSAPILNEAIRLADEDAGISTGYTVTVAEDPVTG